MPLQKTYEINIGQDSIDIDFLDFLAYDKSDKHSTIYDSYNHELAAKWIKVVKLPILLKFTA